MGSALSGPSYNMLQQASYVVILNMGTSITPGPQWHRPRGSGGGRLPAMCSCLLSLLAVISMPFPICAVARCCMLLHVSECFGQGLTDEYAVSICIPCWDMHMHLYSKVMSFFQGGITILAATHWSPPRIHCSEVRWESAATVELYWFAVVIVIESYSDPCVYSGLEMTFILVPNVFIFGSVFF